MDLPLPQHVLRKVAMIGCGKVGAPTADELERIGHNVRRYDIAFDTGWSFQDAISDRDLVLIAVPTPHHTDYDGTKLTHGLPARDFDYSQLISVVSQVSILQPTTPIVIVSTVLPGTIRKLFSHLPNEIIYNPFLIGMGTVQHDLQNPDLIIIGTEDGNEVASNATKDLIMLHHSMQVAAGYESVVNLSKGTWEEAESIKIFYNTFISAKLSIVNMIQDVSMKLGNMNVDVVTDALANATKRIVSPAYMKAGMGDGGPCHPRDNIALRYLSQELGLGYDLFGGIVESREQQARNLAAYIAKLKKNRGYEVYIHGKSFKVGTDITMGSYSVLLGNILKQEFNIDVRYVVPNYNVKEIAGIILLAHQTTELYSQILPGSIVIDPWRSYKASFPGIKVFYYGNTRSTTE